MEENKIIVDWEIDMWKGYNPFTYASKTSYIDNVLDRNAGSFFYIRANKTS